MVTRISGLATGMDIDKIVSDLMNAHRLPVNKLKQKKQIFEWQREAYRDMNLKILDYRNTKLSNYRLEGTFLAKKTDVSGNVDAISAKANNNAINGTLTVQVNTLAKAASNYSSGDIRLDPTFDPSETLNSQAGKITAFGSTTFQINGQEVTFDPSQDSLNDVISRINRETNVSAFYDTTSGRVSFISKNTGLVNNTGDPASDGGKYITFTGSFLVDTLKVSNMDLGAPDLTKAANNANVTINGMNLTAYTSNTLTVNGVELTLKQEGGSESVVNVRTDTDKIVENIKSYIKDYNEILKTINDKVSETRYRSFEPLTDEQKKEMNDRDIELWEDKAQSGMLKNDSILNRALNDLRMDNMAQVDTGSDVYTTLSTIGITTGAYNDKGKLYLIDETKLRKAIEDEPEAVAQLFTSPGNGDSDRSDVGIAQRMYEDMKKALDRIMEKAGSPSYQDSSYKDNSIIGRQLYRLGNDIDNKISYLSDVEDRYYRQFTAMETAINRFNAQSAYLANSFGGGQQ